MKKIIVITGASSGMGTEFARQLFDRSGIDEIWLIARRKDRLESLAAELNKTAANKKVYEEIKRPKPIALPVDISNQRNFASIKELFQKEQTADDSFSIEVLVNCAGFGTYGPFAETPLEQELNMIEVNCTALTALCGYALPFMATGSLIINVASLASFLPLGNFAVYGATKAYTLSFSEALAAEVTDRGINVCALCPGPVSTEFAEVASNGARKKVKHGLPADEVVKHCLKKAFKGKHTAIMAFKWKFKAFASRFVGRYTGARFTYKYCKRPYKH